MAWVLWLAVPVLTPALAAMAVWLRSRPARIPDAEEAMRQHQDYLEALGTPARGAIRVAPRQLND
jgi:hypothetical protein